MFTNVIMNFFIMHHLDLIALIYRFKYCQTQPPPLRGTLDEYIVIYFLLSMSQCQLVFLWMFLCFIR